MQEFLLFFFFFITAEFRERNIDAIKQNVQLKRLSRHRKSETSLIENTLCFSDSPIQCNQRHVAHFQLSGIKKNKAAWDGLGQCCQTYDCQLNIVGELNKLHRRRPCVLPLKLGLWGKNKLALSEEETKDQICWCKHVLLPAQKQPEHPLF